MDLYAGVGSPSSANMHSLSPITSPLKVPLHVDSNLDIAHIDAIININSFAANFIHEAEFTKTIDTHKPAALNLLLSLFNHTCFTNTIHCSLGDMVIHTNQDICCRMELTIAYAGGDNHLTHVQSPTHLIGHEMCDCKLHGTGLMEMRLVANERRPPWSANVPRSPWIGAKFPCPVSPSKTTINPILVL